MLFYKEIFDSNLLCPLCGLNKALHNNRKYIQREHIPPRSIFPKSIENLITVPSCKDCNSGTSKLDEEFKIAMGIYLGELAPEIWQKTIKTLNNPYKKTYKKNLLNTAIPFNNGRYTYKIPFNRKPVETVINKIVRGLHWRITGDTIPNDVAVQVILINQDEVCEENVLKLLNEHGKQIDIGSGIFQANYAIVCDKKYSSLWLLRFYNQDCFIAIISPLKTKNPSI